MHNFWSDHWWLLIPLGAFTIPLAGMALGAFAIWQDHRSRDKVLDALRVYAEQGREPPPELLRALANGGSGGDDGSDWKWRGGQWTNEAANAAAESASTAANEAAKAVNERYGGGWNNAETIRARTEYYTARAAARSARWRAREPIRRWNNAFFLVVGAGVLYFASQHYAANHVLSDRLYVGAVIVGALAAAAVLAAVLASLFRPQ